MKAAPEMNKEISSNIIDLISDIGGKLNDSVKMVRDESDADSFALYRDNIGKIMGIMFFDIMSPIFEKYPDLKPESFK